MVLCVSTRIANAQEFDYSPHPVLNYKFTQAVVNLRLNPHNISLKGSVLYDVTPNINGADTLVLDAPQIKIDSVRSKGRSLNYRSKDGHLYIAVTNAAQRGKQYQVKIYYRAKPSFGLLKSSEGTVWTSMLPRSTRHWLPVKDNPRVEMKVTLSLRFPSDYKVFASGISKAQQMYPDSTKKITFETGRPIPITTLAFGVGHFHGINSFAEPNSIAPGKQPKLVRKTKQIIHKISNVTGMDYPYQRLSLVILNDHHWEEKSYGASTIFLYKNEGNWINQLRRGLIAQWFGVYKHSPRWGESKPIKFLQAVLYYQLVDSAALLKTGVDRPKLRVPTIYSQYSPENWNFWQEYVLHHSATKNIAIELMQQLFKQGNDTITPENFQDAWYQVSGQPRLKLPSYKTNSTIAVNIAADTLKSDTVRYRVNFKLNQLRDTLQLSFKAQKGILPHPVKLAAVIIADSSKQQRQINLADTMETVSLALPAGTQNVRLQAPDSIPLALVEFKPISYSLYQLHHAKSARARVKAARQLGAHTKDTDLQLAVITALKNNQNPKVQAALLQAYGKLTHGAAGTQQRFIRALKSKNKEVQLAAIKELKNYKGPAVTKQLQTLLQNKTDSTLAVRALGMYLQRADSTTALNFVNTLVQQDTSGVRAIAAVGALAKRGLTKRAIKYANFYVKPFYAYPVRKEALKILVAYDDSAKSWQKRLPKLINALDPRIRFLTIKNLGRIPGANKDSLLTMHQEYDARVYGAMKREAK
jgi:HEAT repeat protein